MRAEVALAMIRLALLQSAARTRVQTHMINASQWPVKLRDFCRDLSPMRRQVYLYCKFGKY
jgi:hypothetical protein